MRSSPARFVFSRDRLRHRLHHKLADGLTLIAINGAQQLARTRRVDDRAVVGDRGRGRRSAQRSNGELLLAAVKPILETPERTA